MEDDISDASTPETTATGDEAVDAALMTLDGLAQRPLREHVAAFDAIQAALADRLAETRE